MPKTLDLSGRTFGRLTALTSVRVGKRKGWLCQCSCGQTTKVVTAKLTSGWTSSCGCLHKEVCAATKRTHGMSRTRTYATWLQMNRRCDLPSHEAYKDYGGRGIRVCERWLKFENFYEDVGEPPFEGASLDRIDNDLGYSPENTRWATKLQQANNRRTTRRISFNGVSKTLREWADVLGVSVKTLTSRVYLREWDIERALTTKVRARK